MTLAVPSLTAGEPLILLAAQALLSASGVLEDYLDEQVAGLAAQSVTVTLPVPSTVQIGTWDAWRQSCSPPGLLISIGSPTQWTPDVAGDVYHCETRLMVGILLTEADTGTTDAGAVYLASVAYAQAVAYCIQRHLSATTYGADAGIYEAVIAQTGAEPAPIRDAEGGQLYRVSETYHLVRWQAIQEPPATP